MFRALKPTNHSTTIGLVNDNMNIVDYLVNLLVKNSINFIVVYFSLPFVCGINIFKNAANFDSLIHRYFFIHEAA